jgi:hypothetical protein
VALVHQRPDPERRPDRRLRGECMVAIKNFGATGRGAGGFSAVASNSVPKLGKNVEAFGPHTGRREARLRSSASLELARTVKALRPMGGHQAAGARAPTHAGEQLRDFQGQAPKFEGIVADAIEMPQVRLSLGRPIGASRATTTAALSGTKCSTWGGGYTRKHEAGGGVEMEGR